MYFQPSKLKQFDMFKLFARYSSGFRTFQKKYFGNVTERDLRIQNPVKFYERINLND